jgi:hypothetical protein
MTWTKLQNRPLMLSKNATMAKRAGMHRMCLLSKDDVNV